MSSDTNWWLVGAAVVVVGLIAVNAAIQSPDGGNEDLDGRLVEGNTTLATTIEQEIVDDINNERQAAGLSALSYSEQLAKQASGYSKEMVRHEFYSHNSPVSGPMSERLSCRPGAENLNQFSYAGIFESRGGKHYFQNRSDVADSVVQSWMESDGHRENIMNQQFDEQGVGVAIDEIDGEETVIVTQQLCS